MTQVFGDNWSPETGIKTTVEAYKKKEDKNKGSSLQMNKQANANTKQVKDEYYQHNIKTKEEYYKHLAKPKDKWKVGRELKQLAKQFPHDRVIQRMV